MNEKEIIGWIVGGFVVLLLAGAGAFTGIMGGFIETFGIGFGFLLGGLICLMIIIAFLNIGRNKR